MSILKPEFSSVGKLSSSSPPPHSSSPTSAEFYVFLIEAMNTPREKNSMGNPMPRWISLEVLAAPLTRSSNHPELVVLSSPENDGLSSAFRKSLSSALGQNTSPHMAVVCSARPQPPSNGSPNKPKYGGEIKVLRLVKDPLAPLVRLASTEELSKVFCMMPAEYLYLLFRATVAARPTALQWNPIFVNTTVLYALFGIIPVAFSIEIDLLFYRVEGVDDTAPLLHVKLKSGRALALVDDDETLTVRFPFPYLPLHLIQFNSFCVLLFQCLELSRLQLQSMQVLGQLSTASTWRKRTRARLFCRSVLQWNALPSPRGSFTLERLPSSTSFLVTF